MNKTQEKALFGDVLPKNIVERRNVIHVWGRLLRTLIELDKDSVAKQHSVPAYYALQTERQRREAIGLLIEVSIGAEHDQGGYDPCQVNWLESTLGKPWEEIGTIWEENK